MTLRLMHNIKFYWVTFVQLVGVLLHQFYFCLYTTDYNSKPHGSRQVYLDKELFWQLYDQTSYRPVWAQELWKKVVGSVQPAVFDHPEYLTQTQVNPTFVDLQDPGIFPCPWTTPPCLMTLAVLSNIKLSWWAFAWPRGCALVLVIWTCYA